MDVKSLYTNIPNDEGIEAVKSFLVNSTNRKLSPVIAAFLNLILTLNNFQFNDENILQINGCSMGTICAPPYANLFMGKFEDIHILPLIKRLILLYCRFIDDIFFIWTGSETELLRVTNEINEIHPTIKFDIQYSKKSINFLDTTITITTNNMIKTAIYNKPTDRKAYLHAKSYHPRRTKEAIAYSQALRMRRICSDQTDFERESEKLLKELVERGHDEKTTKTNIEKANQLDRSKLLEHKRKERNSRIPLTYNKNLPDIQKVIRNTWEH